MKSEAILLKKQIEEKRVELVNLETEDKKLEKLAPSKKEKASLEQRLENLNRQLVQQKQEKDQLSKMNASENSSIAQTEREIVSTNQQLAQIDNQEKEISKKRNELDRKKQGLTSGIKELEISEQTLSRQLDASQREYQDTKKASDREKQALNNIMKMLDRYTAEKGVMLNSFTLDIHKLPASAIADSGILQTLCEANDYNKFAEALDKITDFNYQDHNGKTILMHAISRGFYSGVEKLLERQADVNICDKNSANALTYAAAMPHIKYIKIIADRTNPDDIDKPLANFGNKNIFHILVDATKTVLFTSELNNDLKAMYEENGREYAAANILGDGGALSVRGMDISSIPTDHFLSVEVLRGLAFNLYGIEKNNGYTLEQEKIFLILEHLLQKKDNMNAHDSEGMTPFFLACKKGLKYLANKMLDNFNIDHTKGDDFLNAIICGIKLFTSKQESAESNPLPSKGGPLVLGALKLTEDLGSIAPTKDTTTPIKMSTILTKIFTQIDNVDKIDGQDSEGYQALHWAILCDKPKYQILVQESPDKKGEYQEISRTLLDPGSTIFTEKILEKGCNIDHQDNQGKTPLYWAANYQLPKVVKLLLAKGAKPNIANNEAVLPWHVVAELGDLEIMEMLREKLEDINCKTNRSIPYAALNIAAQNGHLETVKWLLDNNADINLLMDVVERPPLYSAMANNHKLVAEELLQKKADVNITDKGGYQALHWALECDRPRLADSNPTVFTEKILEKACNIDHQDNQGKTPLYRTVCYQAPKLVQLLLAKKAKPNIFNKEEITPLYISIAKTDDIGSSITKMLLENRADPKIPMNDGDTTMHMVAAWRNMEAGKMLLEHKADVNAKNQEGKTPLHTILEQEKFSKEEKLPTIKFLLDANADPNLQDHQFHDAHYYAEDIDLAGLSSEG